MSAAHYTPVPSRFPLITNGRAEVYTWHNISTRILAFAALEAGFITLAFYSLSPGLKVPITLPSPLTQSEAKGFWTFLTVVWHTLAIASLKDIALYVFSAEWLFQFQRTGVLEIGVTDRVSKVTSGLSTRLKHQFSGTASRRYKFSMLIFFLGSLVNLLGPSTVSISSTLVDVPTKLQIANVTLGSPIPGNTQRGDNTDLALGTKRATTIVKMELLEKSPYGYNCSDNILIPWPEPGLESAPGGHKFKYDSDVVSYDYQCNWYPPKFNSTDQDSDTTLWSFVMNGEDMYVEYINSINAEVLISPIIDAGEIEHPYGMFFFRGLDPAVGTGLALDLSDIPVLHFDQPFQNMTSATLLICDARPQRFPAQVTLENGTLDAINLGTGASPVGNLPFPLGQIFHGVPSYPIIWGDFPVSNLSVTINSVTRLLFLCDDDDDSCGEDNLKPLPLESISRNMNVYIGSAMKAFLSGYNGSQPGVGAFGIPNFDTFTANALRQEDRGLVFISSLPILVALVIAVGATILVSIFLCYVVKPSDLKSFDLEHTSNLLLS